MATMNVWPTDAADGSVSSEARWRKMARLWTPSGVAAGLNPSLAGTNLTVQPGSAWVDGHYAELTGAQVLAVTANGIVVVRFDPAANTAELLYLDGATTPTQNPSGLYEVMIASMSGGVMTDRRIFRTAMNSPYATYADREAGPSTTPRATVTPAAAEFDGLCLVTAQLYAANVNKGDGIVAIWGTFGGAAPGGGAWQTWGQCAFTAGGTYTPVGSVSGIYPIKKGEIGTAVVGVNSSHPSASSCFVSARVMWQYLPA